MHYVGRRFTPSPSKGFATLILLDMMETFSVILQFSSPHACSSGFTGDSDPTAPPPWTPPLFLFHPFSVELPETLLGGFEFLSVSFFRL